jgi:hypothetical protein
MGNYPVIDNIHQKVYEAAAQPDALNMGDWHTCDTTHCRAGWVVHLAGEGGKKLERQTSTLFAAMQIYKASSPIVVSPVRFYESNEIALSDMKRCAEEELTPAKGAVNYTMEPNTKQPDELKANEQATEQAPAPTAGEALESASQDTAMEATTGSEEGSTEG